MAEYNYDEVTNVEINDVASATSFAGVVFEQKEGSFHLLVKVGGEIQHTIKNYFTEGYLEGFGPYYIPRDGGPVQFTLNDGVDSVTYTLNWKNSNIYDNEYHSGLMYNVVSANAGTYTAVAGINNYIVGTADVDNVVIGAGTGKDWVETGDGDDVVDASLATTDIEIYGGAGDDSIVAGTGKNYIEAGEGDDIIDAQADNGSTYVFNGEFGADSITGSNVDGADDTIVLNNAKFADLAFTRVGNNLIINAGEAVGSVTVEDFFGAASAIDALKVLNEAGDALEDKSIAANATISCVIGNGDAIDASGYKYNFTVAEPTDANITATVTGIGTDDKFSNLPPAFGLSRTYTGDDDASKVLKLSYAIGDYTASVNVAGFFTATPDFAIGEDNVSDFPINVTASVDYAATDDFKEYITPDGAITVTNLGASDRIVFADNAITSYTQTGATTFSVSDGTNTVTYGDGPTLDTVPAAYVGEVQDTLAEKTLNVTGIDVYDASLVNDGAENKYFANVNYTGTAADDTFTSSMGNDTITGLAGSDAFIFNRDNGADVITDINAGGAGNEDAITFEKKALTDLTFTKDANSTNVTVTSGEVKYSMTTTVEITSGDSFVLDGITYNNGTYQFELQKVTYGTYKNQTCWVCVTEGASREPNEAELADDPNLTKVSLVLSPEQTYQAMGSGAAGFGMTIKDAHVFRGAAEITPTYKTAIEGLSIGDFSAYNVTEIGTYAGLGGSVTIDGYGNVSHKDETVYLNLTDATYTTPDVQDLKDQTYSVDMATITSEVKAYNATWLKENIKATATEGERIVFDENSGTDTVTGMDATDVIALDLTAENVAKTLQFAFAGTEDHQNLVITYAGNTITVNDYVGGNIEVSNANEYYTIKADNIESFEGVTWTQNGADLEATLIGSNKVILKGYFAQTGGTPEAPEYDGTVADHVVSTFKLHDDVAHTLAWKKANTDSTGNTAGMYNIVNGTAGDDAALGGIDGIANWIDGGTGADNITGGDKGDVILGGAGNDTLTGGAGDDVLHGVNGNNVISGGVGNDKLYGGVGDDTLTGGTGNDTLIGHAGNDVFNFAVGDGADVIANMDENDTINFVGITSFENIKFERGTTPTSLYITYNANAEAPAVPDTIEVQNFFENTGTPEEPVYTVKATAVTTFSLDGTPVTLNWKQEAGYPEGMYQIVSDADVAGEEVGPGANNGIAKWIVTTNGGDDTLLGGNTDDVLIGGVGQNTLAGGTGNDVLSGGADNDLFKFEPGDGNDIIKDATDGDVIQIGTAGDAITASIERVDNNLVVTYNRGTAAESKVSLNFNFADNTDNIKTINVWNGTDYTNILTGLVVDHELQSNEVFDITVQGGAFPYNFTVAPLTEGFVTPIVKNIRTTDKITMGGNIILNRNYDGTNDNTLFVSSDLEGAGNVAIDNFDYAGGTTKTIQLVDGEGTTTIADNVINVSVTGTATEPPAVPFKGSNYFTEYVSVIGDAYVEGLNNLADKIIFAESGDVENPTVTTYTQFGATSFSITDGTNTAILSDVTTVAGVYPAYVGETKDVLTTKYLFVRNLDYYDASVVDGIFKAVNYLNSGDKSDMFRSSYGDDMVDAGVGADILDFTATAGHNFGNDTVTVNDKEVVNLQFKDAPESYDLVGDDLIITQSGEGSVDKGTVTLKNYANNTSEERGTVKVIVGENQTNLADVTVNVAAGTEYAGSWMNENITGTDGNDNISGGTGDDIINGVAGNDTLVGGVGNDTLVGGDDASELLGGEGNDSIIGGAGADAINAGEGDDYVEAGAGANNIYGDEGNDTIVGGGDNDYIEGNEGDDSIIGGAGADAINAGEGDDYVEAGAGNDTLTGGEGKDTLYGDADDDYIDGGEDDDALFGGDGNDTIVSGEGDDAVLGGDGADTFVFESGDGDDTISDATSADVIKFVDADFTEMTFEQDGNDLVINYNPDEEGNMQDSVTIISYFTVEEADRVKTFNVGGEDYTLEWKTSNVSGKNVPAMFNVTNDPEKIVDGIQNWVNSGNGNDNIAGGDQYDMLAGNNGDDNITGGASGAEIYGGEGNDTLIAGDANSWVAGNEGDDEIYGGAGNDYLFGGDHTSEADAEGADVIFGDAGNDSIFGRGGDDELYGEEGDDYIAGGAGVDTIVGGEGNDTLKGNAGADKFVFAAGDGADVLADATSADIIELVGFENFEGVTFAKDETNLVVNYTENDSFTVQGYFNEDGSVADDVVSSFKLSDGDGSHGTWTLVWKESPATGEEGMYQLAQYDEFGIGHVVQGINTWFDATGDVEGGHVSLQGNGVAFGGDGVDQITASEAASYIDGGAGNDMLFGSTEADTIFGGEGNDILGNSSGDDELYGELGNDTLSALHGNNLLVGGAGNDRLVAGDGNDTLIGGDDSDTFVLTGGNTVIEDADSNDQIVFGESTGLTSFAGVTFEVSDENEDDLVITYGDGAKATVQGYFTADEPVTTFIVGDTPYTLEWHESEVYGEGMYLIPLPTVTEDGVTVTSVEGIKNWIETGEGQDTLNAANAEDMLSGGEGNDLINALNAQGGVEIYGGAGDDVINGGESADFINAGAGDDVVFGDEGDDEIDGGDGNDMLLGEDGNDTLFGGAGNDSIYGGEGDDVLTGEAGKDLFAFETGDGDDVITDAKNTDVITINDVELDKFGDMTVTAGYNLDGANPTSLYIAYNDNDSIELQNYFVENIVDGQSVYNVAKDAVTKYFVNGEEYNFKYVEDEPSDPPVVEKLVPAGDGKKGANVKYTEDLDKPRDIYGTVYDDVINATKATANITITEEGGNNKLMTGTGNDTIYLLGKSQNYVALGKGNNKVFVENAGKNTIKAAGDGYDQVHISDGSNTIDLANGDNIVAVGTNYVADINKAAGTVADVTFYEDVEIVPATAVSNIKTGKGNDWYGLNGGTNIIKTGAGNDHVVMFAGHNTITAGNSDVANVFQVVKGGVDDYNKVTGGGKVDNFFVEEGVESVNVLNGGGGNDIFDIASGDNTINAGGGDDILLLEGGRNNIKAGGGKDTLIFEGGNNVVDGGGGDDRYMITSLDDEMFVQITDKSGKNAITIGEDDGVVAYFNVDLKSDGKGDITKAKGKASSTITFATDVDTINESTVSFTGKVTEINGQAYDVKQVTQAAASWLAQTGYASTDAALANFDDLTEAQQEAFVNIYYRPTNM